MNGDLHVVYRVHDGGLATEEWATYSFPDGIYTVGSSLAEARSELHEAAEDLLGPERLSRIDVIEHIERPMYDGAYLRIAVDRRSLDRHDTADAMLRSLSVGLEATASRSDLEATLPLSASGDRIVVACVGRDTIGWVLGQMAAEDVLAVCLAGPVTPGGRLVSWSYLIREGARLDDRQLRAAEPLSDGDLTSESTISDLLRANQNQNARGRLVGAV